MVKLSPQDLEEINQFHVNNPDIGPALVSTSIPDPVTKGFYKLSPSMADAFARANQDYKEVYGHDIPMASAYRDEARNRAADGAPNSKHLHGDALDINRNAVQKATPFLNAHGLHAIGGTFHGRSEDNHFELHGARHQHGGGGHAAPSGNTGGIPNVSQSTPTANPEPLPDLPAPNLQPGQGAAPIPSTLLDGSPLPAPSRMALDADKANQDLLNFARQPVPQLSLPTAPNLEQIRQNAGRFVQAGMPVGMPEEPKTPGVIEGVGNILNDLRTGAGNAFNSIAGVVTNPGQLFNQAGQAITNEAQHTGSPLDLLGGLAGGAAMGVGDLANGILGLPADIANSYLHRKTFAPALSIPTGDLQNYLKDKQASTFVGQLLPFVAAEALTGGEATPGLLARLGKSAGTGAAFGGLNDSHGAGLGGRLEGAINMGALGLGLGAAGELPGMIRKGINPDHLTAADIAKLTASGEKSPYGFVGGRHVSEIPFPEQNLFKGPSSEINPLDLTHSFNRRSLGLSDNPLILPKDKGAESLKLLGPNGENISTVERGLPTAYQRAMERFAEPEPGKSIDLLHGTALPEGRPDLKLIDQKAYNNMLNDIEGNKSTLAGVLQTIPENVGKKFQGHGMTGNAENLAKILDGGIDPNREFFTGQMFAKPDESQYGIGVRDNSTFILVGEKGKPLDVRNPPHYVIVSDIYKDSLSGLEKRFPGVEFLTRENAASALTEGKIRKPNIDFLKPQERSSNDLLNFAKEDRSADLIKDINREPSSNNLLEFPTRKTEPGLMEILGPNGRPVERPTSTPTTSGEEGALPSHTLQPEVGGEVFHQGMDPATVNQMAHELATALQDKGGQLVTIAEAQRFIKENGYPGTEHLLNAIEAGKNNQTLMVEHQPLNKGGQASYTREVHPFAFEKRTIKGKTEVGNLIYEHSPAGDGANPDYAAIRDNLVQRLQKNGIDVQAADQAINGKAPRTIRKILNKLADRLPDKERTHIYFHDHNFGESARPNPEGARRLDRITSTSLTGKANHESVRYNNQIAPAFEALDKLASMPDAPPAIKRIIKQMASGTVSRPSLNELRNVLRNASKEVLQNFCKL